MLPCLTDYTKAGAGHDTPQSLLRSAAHSNVSSVNDNANEIEISYAFDDDSTAQSTTYDDSAYASRPALSLDPLSPMRPTRTPPRSMVEDILGQDMNLWPAQGNEITCDLRRLFLESLPINQKIIRTQGPFQPSMAWSQV